MALIGEMHYLTIGNKTYSIPISGGSSVSYLPTLTSGTEIGKLTVDSTTYTLYGPTPNAGTVTSVRVQATSPVQSSTSTAQSATLNTTISLANGYGDTKNPYGTKTANYVLAGPTTGNAAAPSFRKLVAADIPDLSGTYSTTDEKMKWTASTSSNTYYPLQSTSTATTSTANTLNSVSFYQYYNTAGGYRRLILGNSTAYTSSGGAYGTIRLYGTGATYYGDLNPGTVGTNSLTANRTWTLPNATGTIALTSDIPSVPTNVSAFTNDAGYITSYTDKKVAWSAYAEQGFLYPLCSPDVSNTDGAMINTSYASSFRFEQSIATTLAGSAARLHLGTGIAATSANGLWGTVRLYGTGDHYGNLNPGDITAANSLTANRTWTLPDATGTIALTSDIPTVPTITLNGSSTTSPSFYAPTGAGTSGYYLKSNGTGAPSWTAFPNIPTISQTLTSGVEIAQVTVGSTTTKLYAPQGGGSSTAVIVSEEYTFSFSLDAGTIGTRGYQGSTTISKTGYTPVSVVTTYVGSSASYMPIPFLGGSNLNTLYCNIYRSTSSAVSNSSVRVTVYYALDDGNAVSVNTYNGEVS